MNARRWAAAAMFAAVSCARDSSPRALRVEVRSSPYGDYIADDAGRALYAFSGDAPNQSGCLTNCSTVWLPVAADELPAVDSPLLDRAKLSIIGRPDSIRQLSYAGLPLYYSSSGLKPGDIWGHYAMSFGGHFALVGPAGKPLPPPK
jgi:predicted lipoprotein with Yx(FWY)xxD motif